MLTPWFSMLCRPSQTYSNYWFIINYSKIVPQLELILNFVKTKQGTKGENSKRPFWEGSVFQISLSTNLICRETAWVLQMVPCCCLTSSYGPRRRKKFYPASLITETLKKMLSKCKLYIITTTTPKPLCYKVPKQVWDSCPFPPLSQKSRRELLSN